MKTSVANDTTITLALTLDEFFFLKQCVNHADPAKHGLFKNEFEKINNQFNNLSRSLFTTVLEKT